MTFNSNYGVENPLGRCFAWTPFVTDGGMTDYDAIVRLLSTPPTEGLDAAVFGAGLSGGWHSNPEDTIELVRRVREARPGLYVMMGALDTNTARLMDNIHFALSKGEDKAPQEFMIAMPRVSSDPRSWTTARNHLQTVMQAFPQVRFTVYENAAYGPIVAKRELLMLKGECPNFIRIKSSTSEARILELQGALPKQGIEVVTGFDTLILPMAIAGVQSYIGGSDLVFQTQFSLAHRLAAASSREEDGNRQTTLAGAAIRMHQAMYPSLCLDDDRIPVPGWKGQPSFIAYLVAAELAASRAAGNTAVRDNVRLYTPLPVPSDEDCETVAGIYKACRQALDGLPLAEFEALLSA